MRALLVFAVLAAAGAQTTTTGVISGSVVRGDTGEPVRRAVVTLRPAEPGRRSGSAQSAVSGADGTFEVTGVAAGQYRIRVSRNGFLTGEYGQRGFDKPGAPVTVTAGGTASNLVIKLMPAGAISGTVVNEDGERVSYVTITALKAGYAQGRVRWTQAGGAMTNDLGEYRIFDLTPGRYYLSARYSASYGLGFRAEARNAAPGEEGYAVQYYPGTFDPTAARAIDIAPGTDSRGVDMRLAPTRMVKVSGVVRFEGAAAEAGPRQGRGPGGPRPMLSLVAQLPITIAGPQGRLGAMVNADGSFEIRGVTPGAYSLIANLFDRNRRQSARMPLVVGNTNIEGVTLTLAPVPVLTGQIQVDPKDNVKLDGLRVRLQGQEDIEGGGPGGGMGFGGGMGPGAGVVSAEGKFSLENLSPQVYSLSVTGLPETHYISAVRLSDVDLTNAPIDLSGGVLGNLVIALSAGAGSVQGSVSEEKQPASGATVVLIPEGARREVAHFYKTAATDQNGRFQMTGIAPGEYKLYAWDEVQNEAWRDPAFQKKFENKGKTVSLKTGGQERAELTLLSAAEGGPGS